MASVCSYLGFRLLGSALPLLSLPQLKEVLSGEVMMHYGEHVVSAQVSILLLALITGINIKPHDNAEVVDFINS